jgi:hypothetical protein
MRWTAPSPARLAAPARSTGVRLPEKATVAHRAYGAERLAAAAALVVQALIFIENFSFPWGLLLAAPALLVPLTASAWRSPIVWGLIALADFVPLLMRPLFVPNHLFLMTYVALALCLAGVGERRVRLMAANARWILAGVMALAALQKLLSVDYSGFVGFMIATGGFAEPVLGRGAAAAGALADNAAQAGHFLASVPVDGATQALRVPAGFAAYARGAAIGIIVVEGALAALVLFRPDRALFHIAYAGFLTVLGLVRSELLFLSALAMLGLLISCARPSRWRWLYLAILLVALPAATSRLARSASSLGEGLDRAGLSARP